MERDSEILKLLSAKRIVEGCLRLHQEDLNLLNNSRKVSVQDLLKESLQIQFNCHAPKEYTIGMPLFKSHPPAPQPEEMRIGSLPSYNKSVSSSQSKTLNTKNSLDTTSKTSSAYLLLKGLSDDMAVIRNQVQTKRSQDAIFPSTILTKEGDGEVTVNQLEVEDTIAHKKARTVNISFGMSDSEDSDEE